jgi:hypothetical protein
VDWRVAYRILGVICVALAAGEVWRVTANPQTHDATGYSMFLLVGGVSAWAFSYRSEAVLIEKFQKFLRAERRFVLGSQATS